MMNSALTSMTQSIPPPSAAFGDIDLRSVDPRTRHQPPPAQPMDLDMRMPPMQNMTYEPPPQQRPATRSQYPADPRQRGSNNDPRDPRQKHQQQQQQSSSSSNSTLAAQLNRGISHDASDQEKAALIMQVLKLTDEQIAMLPPEQRASILVLKEQIAKTANR